MPRIARDPLDTPIAEKILEAALRQFGKAGPEASIKDIAKDAGVTAAAVYYHYKDKRDLLFRGLEWMALRVLRACEARTNGVDKPLQALEQFVTGYIQYQLKELAPLSPMYASLVHGTGRQLNQLAPKQQQRLRALEQALVDLLAGILDRGCKQKVFIVEDSKVHAFAILGMCEHTLNWVSPSGPLSIDAIAAYFAILARRMVTAS